MKLSEAIAALERGEEVEVKRKDRDVWHIFDGLTAYHPRDAAYYYQFRLKPKPVEPMKVWVNFYPERMLVHTSKEIAERDVGSAASRIAVPFREVVPLTEDDRIMMREIREFYIPCRHTYITFLLNLLKKQGVE